MCLACFDIPETNVNTKSKANCKVVSGPKLKCVHPSGLRERFKRTSNIEEALGVLLEASHEECRVRSRARLASTLEEALDTLFVCGDAGEEERADKLNFDEFEDEQLFSITEAKKRNT